MCNHHALVTLSGKVLALEGIDGSGKSTIAILLKKEFERSGMEVCIEAEPTGLIRDLATGSKINGYSAFLLFSADRYNHQHRIMELRSRGALTILDRYVLSSYAYQGADLMKEFGSFSSALKWMESVSSRLMVVPDLTIILDSNPEKCLERVSKRGKPNPIFENMEFLNVVRENYIYLGKVIPNVEIVNSELPADAVLEKCIEIIRKRFDL